jgi:alanine racemase
VSAGPSATSGRWAWAEVDLAAVRHNVAHMRSVVAPAEVWAVVKADGYGHGAVPAALAALDAGATGLCVALTQEGIELRSAGIEAPILLLSEQPLEQVGLIVAHGLIATVASRRSIEAVHAAARVAGQRVHLKVDTGMHRGGCPPAEALSLAQMVVGSGLVLDGVFTHLAVADEVDNPFTAVQLDTFDDVLAQLATAGLDVGIVHAANSAGALAHPRSHRSMVRIGIAAYGIAPGAGVAHLTRSLRPALSLHSRVSFVRRVDSGERVSYGLRYVFERPTNIAVVPIGYADGVPRRLFDAGGQVLIGGRRRSIVGAVTMDQLVVDVGDDAVQIGDAVVLIGAQGLQCITADEWANRLGTIGYEVVCSISKRIDRVLTTRADR